MKGRIGGMRGVGARFVGVLASTVVGVLLVWCAPAFAGTPGFTYTDTTGGCQAFNVPAGFTMVRLSAVGAGGGAPFALIGDVGGSGGSASGQVSVADGQALYLCVDVGGGSAGGGMGGGGGASGASLGPDFSSPVIVAGGGGGGSSASGGDAGSPVANSGGGSNGSGGGGGDNTTGSGGAGGNYFGFFFGGGGSVFTAVGPGSGGNGEGRTFGAGGGGGYYGGGGGAGNSGGGGGSDFCAGSVSGCQILLATSGPSVTVQHLAPQSITFPSTAVTYGQADFSPASADSGLAVSYSNPSGQCSIDNAGLVTITGAGSCTITADQGGNGQYAPASSVTQTFIVSQAVVHVDANAASKMYGQSDPSSSDTLRAADFVNGDTAATSGITGAASCSIAAHSQNAGTHSGVVTCQPGSLSSGNYTFAAGSAADLTISQAVVHVDANAASKPSGTADPSPSATLRSSDLANGDTTSTAGITRLASCTIAAHSQAPGTYAGVISCASGTLAALNYSFASGNTASLTITAVRTADLSIDVSPPSSRTGSTLRPGVRFLCPAGGRSCSASESASVEIGGANTPSGFAHQPRHAMTIGQTQSTIPTAGSVSPTLQLNKLGMILLSDHRHLRVQIAASGQVQGGTPVTATKPVVLQGQLARYKVSGIKVQRDGTISLRVRVSAPGQVSILISAWKTTSEVATAARLLNPGQGRFAVGRASATAKTAGVLVFLVRPNARARRLVADSDDPATLRLWVSYLPLYAFQTDIGYYGLQPGSNCSTGCLKQTLR